MYFYFYDDFNKHFQDQTTCWPYKRNSTISGDIGFQFQRISATNIKENQQIPKSGKFFFNSIKHDSGKT